MLKKYTSYLFRYQILFAVLVVSLFFSQTVKAQFPYTDGFTNSTSPGMVCGGSPASAFLTAPSIDADGSGYLRLTTNGANQTGYAYNSRTFSSTNGLDITFDYYTYGGTGADGISFFLFDATAASSFQIGGFGGSLGYAPRSDSSSPGLSKGFLGIGIDEFGKFSEPLQGRVLGPGQRANSVTIRGDGDGSGSVQPGTGVPNSNYEFLYNIQTSSSTAMTAIGIGSTFSIAGNQTLTGVSTPTRAAGLSNTHNGYRRVRIVIEPNGGASYIVNVYITERTGGVTSTHRVVNNLTYTPTAAIPANFMYGFGSSTGGSNNFHEIRNIDIAVPASVPLQPVLADIAKTGLEDATITFTTANFTNSFLDPNGFTTLTKIRVQSLPANGTLLLSGVPITLNQEIVVADLPNITFVPNANWHGSTSFDWNGSDATLYATTAEQVNITVTSVNDAPAGTDNTINVLTNATDHVLTAANFGFTDANDVTPGPVNTMSVVKITTIPALGTLELSNVAVTAGQDIAIADINSNLLTYTPVAAGEGSPYTSFTFQVQDNGGTANGGVALDQTPNTLNINVGTVPAITLTTANPAICFGTASAGIVYSGTTGTPTKPNRYSIDFVSGISDIVDGTFDGTVGGTISVTGLGAIAAGTYNGTLTVRHSGNGFVSGGTAVSIVVNPLPAIGMAVSDPTICSGAAATITLSSSVLGINYQLRLDSDNSLVGAVVAGTGGDITFSASPTSTTTYNILATNATTSCSAMVTDKSIVTVNTTGQPSVISGLNVVCIGATGVTYSVTNEPGHTYNWTYSGTGHTITAGTGTNSITVSYSTSATSGTWSVTATNTTTTCTSIARTYAVTVNSTPQPSVVTGTASVCVGSTGVNYSVTAVSNTTYNWTYSGTGATITSGGGTNAIIVTYAANATSGTWSVTATGTNTCASIPRTFAVTLNALPTIAAITGTLDVCIVLTTQLLNATTGGTWSSSNTSIATVNSSTGVVTGVAAGTTTITYTTAANGNGCINTASATVTVNASPTVAAITGATGTTVGSTTQLASTTTGGTWSSSNTTVATVSSTGLITGVAAGTATITYAVTSGTCTSSVTKVITITAAPVNNNPPVAVADAYSAVKGGTLTVAAPGVLNNDSDPNSNPITAIKVTDPANGTLILNSNGSFTYVHNNGTSTSDSFTYKVNDGIVDGNTVTVTITINASNTPPVIVDIPKTGVIDQPVTFTAGDFTSKFTDPNGDALNKIRIVTLPPSGTLRLNGVPITVGQEIPAADLPNITFVPPAGFSGGPISFQWNGSDGTDYATTPKNVNITIDPTSISITVTEVCIGDVPWVQYTITGQGFTPAANSATIRWKKMDGTIVRELTNQALTGQLLWPGAAVDANGIPTAWPGWNFTGGQWVQISDGLRPQMRLHISINPETEVIVNYPPATPFCSANPNRPPVVSNITKSSTGFLPIPFTVADFTSKYTDPDGDPLVKVRIQTLPPDGVLKLNGIPVTINQEIPVADLAKLTFEPALNWSGTTNFTWNGSDGDVYATSPANTALTVIAPSDPNAKIGLAKNLASVTPALNGTYDVKFVFTAVNFGPNGLENISIKDNLALAFGGAEVTVKTVTAFGNLKANSSFNGSTNTELLLPTSRLVAGEEAKLELLINVKLLLTSGVFQNTATAEAISSLTGFKVTDVSTNGLRPDPNSTADVSPSETTPIKLDALPAYVPAGFSPNGDGMNDKFVVQNANGKHVSLEMYNRWGNRVYKSDDYKNDWGGEVTEGFFLGRDIPDGTYYYIIIIDKKDKYAGFITVNR